MNVIETNFSFRPESYANLIFVAQVTRWEVVNYAVGKNRSFSPFRYFV